MWDDSSLWFWVPSPWWWETQSVFSWTCWPPVYLLWKSVCSNPLPIFQLDGVRSFCLFLILSCVCVSYVLDIKTHFHKRDLQIFFPFTVSPFILLMVSFVVRKRFSLTQSRLLILAFVPSAFGVRSKNWLPRLMSGASRLCFLLGVIQFQVLHSSR